MNYRKHKEKWQNCERCALCTRRKNVVLCRGRLPCDVLFIGEAPGQSEDVLGKPFVGPAGKLLDSIIEEAIDGQFDYALTNVVACIPLDENGDKMSEPPEEAIKACNERLLELMTMANPKLCVAVGKIPAKWVPKLTGYGQHENLIAITHPAAILRMDVSQQGLAIQRCVAAIEAALDGIEV